MKTKHAQLATILLIALTGCSSTIANDQPYAPQNAREYFLAEPSFMDDLSGVQADMSGVSAATKTGNVGVVEIACENLSESASEALAKYSDAPVQPMLDAFQNLVDSAAACMAGDYSGASTFVNQASVNFEAATAQINAQG